MPTTPLELIFPILSTAFGIFVLWVLWKVVQSLKSIDASLKQISHAPTDRL